MPKRGRPRKMKCLPMVMMPPQKLCLSANSLLLLPPSEETSPEFEEFLEFIADKVPLKGWPHFRAGLDVQSTCSLSPTSCPCSSFLLSLLSYWGLDGTTGEEGLYIQWKNNEIMYHVSTLLPFHPEDAQQALPPGPVSTLLFS